MTETPKTWTGGRFNRLLHSRLPGAAVSAGLLALPEADKETYLG